MPRCLIACLVIALVMSSTPAFAQGPPTRKFQNPAMALAGITTAVIGGTLLIPNGDTYEILGSSYCVSPSGRRVDYGACTTNPDYHGLGWFLVGAGGVMTMYGLWPIAITPTHKGLRASMTVAW